VVKDVIKMNIYLKISATLIMLLCIISSVSAQNKTFELPKQSYSDSLYARICTPIYFSFYTPSYMATTTPTFTILKIEINSQGKVIAINFSDSADSVFVKAYKNRKKYDDEISTLEKYVKAKLYTDVSLLMPVSFEPKYPNSVKDFSYDKMESIMQWNKKEVVGRVIMLPSMNIRILPNGNM